MLHAIGIIHVLCSRAKIIAKNRSGPQCVNVEHPPHRSCRYPKMHRPWREDAAQVATGRIAGRYVGTRGPASNSSALRRDKFHGPRANFLSVQAQQTISYTNTRSSQKPNHEFDLTLLVLDPSVGETSTNQSIHCIPHILPPGWDMKRCTK